MTERRVLSRAGCLSLAAQLTTIILNPMAWQSHALCGGLRNTDGGEVWQLAHGPTLAVLRPGRCALHALGQLGCVHHARELMMTSTAAFHEQHSMQSAASSWHLLRWQSRAWTGNFFSAAFEDTCLALVGASGGVFGMVGLFIADMIVNFSYIKRQVCFWQFPAICLSLPCSVKSSPIVPNYLHICAANI